MQTWVVAPVSKIQSVSLNGFVRLAAVPVEPAGRGPGVMTTPGSVGGAGWVVRCFNF